MAIKQSIELVGDDIVIRKVKNMSKELENSFGALNFKIDLPDPKPIQEFADQGIKLKDAMHTLQPILKTAGASIGEFGAFARLAGGNVVLLGAAVVGAATVAFAKLSEATQRIKGQLDDAFGGRGRGQQAFEALTTQAKQFGTSVTGLAPGLESFEAALTNIDRTAKGFVALKAEDLPGASLGKNVEATATAYGNFIKLLRAGRQTQDEAEKTAKTFFDTMKDGATLTSAALKALPVGTINEIKNALGGGGLTNKAFFEAIDSGVITIDKLQQALVAFGPQAQKAFDAKAIKTLNEEATKLATQITQNTEDLTILEAVINRIAKARLASGAFVGPTQEQAGLGEAAGGRAPFPTPEQAGRAGADAASAFNEGFLKKGFVFPPSVGTDAGTQLGKAIVNNPFFTEEFPQELAVPVSEGVKKALEQLATEEIKNTLGEKFAEVQGPIVESFAATGTKSGERFVEGLAPISPQATSFFQTIYDGIVQIFSRPIPVTFQQSGGGLPGDFSAGFAGGGMVRGSGTTTSDSILAFLSNQEFVVNARAVSHYGPALFAALNAMRLPRDFIGRFAMGGLARSVSGNRFAGGGQVRSGNPVILKIDRQTFNMTAGDDTVASLKRFAVAAQLASTGRKPSWVK